MIPEKEYEVAKSKLFSRYVKLYNKSDDKLAFIANLRPSKDDLTDKINFNRNELDNSLKKIIDLYKPFRKSSGWDENEMSASGLLRWYAEGDDLFLRLARYYDFSAIHGIPMHNKAREGILGIINQTTIDQIHKDRIKKVLDELDTLARRVFRRNIINYFIEFIESRTFPEKIGNGYEEINTNIDIPQDIKRAIHQVALEIPKNSSKNNYDKISNALHLYHSSDLNQEEIAEEMGIPKSTFSTWKIRVEDKLK